jgi:hypothetical protein
VVTTSSFVKTQIPFSSGDLGGRFFTGAKVRKRYVEISGHQLSIVQASEDGRVLRMLKRDPLKAACRISSRVNNEYNNATFLQAVARYFNNVITGVRFSDLYQSMAMILSQTPTKQKL